MPDGMSVDLQGFAALDAQLQELPMVLRGDALKDAVRAGLQPIAEEARRRAPRGPASSRYGGPAAAGNLAKGIVVRILRGRPGDTGIAGKVGFNGDVGWYARWVELTGARPHFETPRRRKVDGAVHNARVLANPNTRQIFGYVVHHPGMRPRPFLRPAFDLRIGDAVRAMKAALATAIDRFVAGASPGQASRAARRAGAAALTEDAS